jgi:hypothetical protein
MLFRVIFLVLFCKVWCKGCIYSEDFVLQRDIGFYPNVIGSNGKAKLSSSLFCNYGKKGLLLQVVTCLWNKKPSRGFLRPGGLAIQLMLSATSKAMLPA